MSINRASEWSTINYVTYMRFSKLKKGKNNKIKNNNKIGGTNALGYVI